MHIGLSEFFEDSINYLLPKTERRQDSESEVLPVTRVLKLWFCLLLKVQF